MAQRQTSVLREIQETQEKDSLDGRYARLMSELSVLCSDRSNVITTDSLAFFAANGRAEAVKLERELDRGNVSTMDAGSISKTHLGGKHQEELLSADAARRQRVEELTRFFMEAKSDIEFALGGSREYRESQKDKDKDTPADSERGDDDRENETGDEEEDKDDATTVDPARRLARLHSKLLTDKVDNRVYNAMLGQIREQDPALYGAILCHPLITGLDPKKEKKKKKKRKDRERRGEKLQSTASSNSMLTPDFTAEPLSKGETITNVSRFVAKAIADGSLQGLLLATKLVLSVIMDRNRSFNDSDDVAFPLVSHLRVLRGEKAPEYPLKQNPVTVQTGKDLQVPATSQDQKMSDSGSADNIEARASSDSRNAAETSSMSGVMDLDSDSGSLAKLRARLSRFGDDGDEGEDDDEEEDEDDDQGDEAGSTGEEGVDEDALMARAIALSLSPEINLRDNASCDNSPGANAPDDSDMTTEKATLNEAALLKPRPPKLSPEEILELGPFALPEDSTANVDGITVAIALIAQMSNVCLDYINRCQKGILPSNSAVQPHPLTFMLINALLIDLHTTASHLLQEIQDPSRRAKWKLFVSCSLLSMFRVLETHFFHIEAMGISPASVGLGRIPKPFNDVDEEEDSTGNPLLDSLRILVVEYVETTTYGIDQDPSSDVVGAIIFSKPSTNNTIDVERVAAYYWRHVREQAMAAWTRGIAHFYSSQRERHELLTVKLTDCLKMSRSRQNDVEWKFQQLDLLCARLSLPDLAQFFVPTCSDIIEEDEKLASTPSGKNQILGRVLSTPIDDGALQNAASKTGRIKAKWSPTIIRASLEAGSLTTRCLLDYIVEHAPPGLVDACGLSSSTLGEDARSVDLLSSAYEQMWDYARKMDLKARQCINRLPSLIDLLRESILSAEWYDFKFSQSYELVHTPLLPILEEEKRNDSPTLNARILFLRSIQDLMIQRLAGSRGDEPPALEFDASRCAETMTLSDNNQTAKQYTAKQWGMVMATTGCPPNTGIHEWAVRLDRCEKGHIFLGVCTRDASVATYVGGDRQGWGLIGTRALWHNRSKVRGDYGDGFSTGSVVRVRLNTDSGALSFGVDDNDWGIAFDGLTQHGTLYPAIGLYQRDDQVTILPVQSADESAFATSGSGNLGGLRGVAIPAVLKPFLHHAGTLLDSCCAFLSSSELAEVFDASRQQTSLADQQKVAIVKKAEQAIARHPLLLTLATPLISSFCVIKNYHGLASTLAMQFIPWCIQTVRCLENVNQAFRLLTSSEDGACPLAGDLRLNVGGEWELKSMAAGNIPAQQYHLTLTQGQDNAVYGRSSGSFTTVTLNGIVHGTKVCFLETWRQGGTCLVEGRLRADGAVFNGSYEDAKSHTSGNIVGNKIDQGKSDKDTLDACTWVSNAIVILEMVTANLLGRFSHVLTNLPKDDLLAENVFIPPDDDELATDEGGNAAIADESSAKASSSECSNDEYEEWINASLLSGGLPMSIIQAHLRHVLARQTELTGYNTNSAEIRLPMLDDASKSWLHFVLPKTLSTFVPTVDDTTVGPTARNPFLQDLVTNRGNAVVIDQWVSRHVGESPFVRLGGEPMKVARRTICAAMLWHSGFLSSVMKIVESAHENLIDSEVRPHENLMHIWRAAQRVIEWAIRAKNSMGSTYAIVAGLVIRKAQFLLDIEPSGEALAAASAVCALSSADVVGATIVAPMVPSKSAVYEHAERIYSEVLMQVSRFIEAPIRISHLQSIMLGNATRAFLRTVGLLSFRKFAGDSGGGNTRSALSGDSHDIVQSSFALSSTLQWLSPSLHESKMSGTHAPSARDISDINSDVGSFPPSSGSLQSHTNSTHYLAGLGGCGKHLKNDLRESFESLYGYLCASLSRATWARDMDLQLVLLQAWGIIIQPDDHAFLSRVGIFRVLQTVLDEARGSSDSSIADISNNVLDERNLIIESKKKIVQAALKVVHLLAAQVAHAGDTADGFLNVSELQAIPGLSLGSIPLLRKPSGPETLGKSVFHMLYTELKNALAELRSSQDTRRIEDSSSNIGMEPTDAADPSISGADGEHMSALNDAQEYCYQICSLLYSVSGSPVCRSHLSSSRWLKLLLALVNVNSPQIQRRILKLLRRLLPALDPASIKVRFDDMDSFDVDSDEDVDTEDHDVDHASTLINFFAGIVGFICPPSVAEIMMYRLDNRGDSRDTLTKNATMGHGNNAVMLAAEVVLLLRSLYGSEKWAGHLNQTVVNALSSIPLKCVTETDEALPTTTTDSDVEMEDISREMPSLEVWKSQTARYLSALSALCILDGHIEGLHIGGTVKIMPRSGSPLQEIAFRGARGMIVSYEPEKSVAEVLLCPSRAGETTQQQSLLYSGGLPTRPVRVPVDDLFAVPEVELPANVFSNQVLNTLLVQKFVFFLSEVKKSLAEVQSLDSIAPAEMDAIGGEDSEDDDDMSNDGSSSSPSGLDSEMIMHGGSGDAESEAESDLASPCHKKSLRTGTRSNTSSVEPTDIMSEMEKESRLHRMLLCQHGLRASATLLKDNNCAAAFIRGIGPHGLMNLLRVAISETPSTAGVGDIASLEESWLLLWSRWYNIRSAFATPTPQTASSGRSNNEDETQADSLTPGPMVQQMMEMGFPKEWCEVALARCSHNVEAAINFCFEHSSDMERLLAQYKAGRDRGNASGSKSQRKDELDVISPLLEQLSEMGFPMNWCKKALAANRNNVDAALTWILSNGEALEAEDRREEEAKQRSASGEPKDVSESRVAVVGDEASLMANPLRAVSGQACIGEHDLMVEGLVGGGFASVGAPDCLVTSGRWYYEAILHTSGCIQIGWADVAFSGAADRGDGVGDGAHSWAYDGWREQKWHGQSSPWGSKWKQGDVVGCGIDIDAGTIIFSLNGKMRSANMGVAFRAVKFARGMYPCASFNRRERLQFNLGGSPFKYAPPPGFRPILSVLTDTFEPEAIPKGFTVIGSREDCLEESMGEEAYSSDARYFPRDIHPSVLRGSSSHGRNSNLAASTSGKADALAEVKAIPDDRVYIELLLVTRSLAILQARRALLTLLAKWPHEEVGAFAVGAFLSTQGESTDAPSRDDAAQFIDFIKLIAGLSGHNSSNAVSSVSLSLPENDVAHLLDCGATGRYALGLLSVVTQSALDKALSQSTSVSVVQDPLIDAMLLCIASEVKRASQRQYARIPWDASDAAITASFLQITAEAGQPWSDKEVLNHPNLFLAEWISGLMIDALTRHQTQLPRHAHDHIRQQLLLAWITSLKSPSLCVKDRGATILAGIFQDMLPKDRDILHNHTVEGVEHHEKESLEFALQALPLQRLVNLLQERILKEYPNVPVCSRYLQSITELVSAAGLAMQAVRKSTEELCETNVSNQLAACKQIEADLYPLDVKEYEETQAAKKQRLEQEAEEALRRKRLAEEAGDATEKDRSVVTDDNNDKAEDDDATRAGPTNMEVDNSDSEEASDITLSAIANMVAEDSDVVAAAAAIAAAANSRLTLQRHTKGKSSSEAQKKEADFEYVFPDIEPELDTSILDAKDVVVLEAAKRGIMGEELRGWHYGSDVGVLSDTNTQLWSGTITQLKLRTKTEADNLPELKVGCKVIRGPNWKWRDQDGGEGSIGVVEGVSPWSGVDGEGMSVRWPNDSLYTYRWGADGNYDLIHVEVDEHGNIIHQYPTPKRKHDDEGTFGSELHLGVLLHIFDTDDRTEVTNPRKVTGVIELPDYGAAVTIIGQKYADGSLCIQELQLTRGNPDMGWMLRFGTEKWQPGTKYVLRPVVPMTEGPEGDASTRVIDTLRGEYFHTATYKGELVEVRGEIAVSTKYLFTMDPHNHFSTLGISDDGMTVTCHSGESRNLALGTVGFTTGIHYWEIRVDQAEFGSVFLGVCEKANPPGSQAALSSRLNRWHGWGFVNFRATYHNSTERIYGDHFNAGDTIGVRLDMEQGKLSFFMDGIKFGEHIVADLGVAFENIKGERSTRTLYPCIGMRKGGDRVSLNGKWISLPGIPPRQILETVMDVSTALHAWYVSNNADKSKALAMPANASGNDSTLMEKTPVRLPEKLLRESWGEWKRWVENRWQRYPVRPRGVVVDFDISPESCIRVSKAAGLEAPFLAGDRVRMCSKCGQELNQPEEAVVLGVYRECLWYRTETQGNEGADEGRSWAWYWSSSDLVELILIRRGGKDMTLIENNAMDLSDYENSPAFTPRSDLEEKALTHFPSFVELATRAHSTTSDMQLVERLNTYCATIGSDVTNLKISDVIAPDETMDIDNAESRRSRTRSLVQEDYFSTPALKSITGPELRARCAVLRILNNKILRVLPMISIQRTDNGVNAIEVAGSPDASKVWHTETLSTSLKLRSLRRLIFTSTKRAFWDDVLRATTTSTPLPSDEYEDPREIRVIRINRIQAQASKLSLLAQPGDRLRRSVFGQLYREMRTWNDSFFRRAYCGKGHGGQRRAFKVKFLGEGVNDYGGPYRAVFEQVVDELQMDNVELSKGEQGLLPLLIPCPNRRSGTGSNQDKFLLNPSCGTSFLANGPMALELHRFLGKIIGTAVRHGLQMGLDLPALVWRPLAGLDVNRSHLEAVDIVTTNNLSRVEECNESNCDEILEYLTFTTPLSDGTEVPLCPVGENMSVTMENRDTYVRLVEKMRLSESSQQLASLREGLAAVLPMELAPLFTPRELEVLICGRREVDVDLLRQCTEYSEGADEAMPHVQAFWEVLKEMTSDDRTAFLRFVWARSRMPNSAKDFPMNFKIQSAHDSGAQVDPDKYLPHAQTCFFALRLPMYSSKEILRSKLLYAIQNSPNMDADVRLHNAEGWADA